MIFKRIFYLSLLILVFCSGSVFAKAAPHVGYEKALFEKAGSSYSMHAEYPKITNDSLPGEVKQRINSEIEQYVHKLFDDDLKAFIKNGTQWTKEELKKIAGRDSIDISFKVVRFDDHLISMRFEKYYYGIGAAHGLTNIYGFNYDIKKMSLVKLADLFEPGTDYLRQLSDYCIKDLKRQLNPDSVTSSWIMEGAAPKEERLKEFAIGKNNLIIYFSEGQVIAYSEGAQKVKIPFSMLTGLRKLLVSVSTQDKSTKNNASNVRVSGDVTVSTINRKGF